MGAAGLVALQGIDQQTQPESTRLQFDKGAEWCRSTLHDEQEAKDTEDMAEHYMRVCESCNKYPELEPATVFEGWLLGEELGNPYETRRQAASHMLASVRRLDKD